MLGRVLAGVAGILCAATVASAQLGPGDGGFRIVAPVSGTSGTFCSGFSCTAIPANVLRGENVELEVRGMFGGAYAVLFSIDATSCTTVKPVLNSLLLDPPIPVALVGTLTIPETVRACPGGIARVPLQFPTLPVSYRVSMQAVVQTSTRPSLAWTAALTVTAL